MTSPGSVPIDLAIPRININRDKSGLFCIQPAETGVYYGDLWRILGICGTFNWLHGPGGTCRDLWGIFRCLELLAGILGTCNFNIWGLNCWLRILGTFLTIVLFLSTGSSAIRSSTSSSNSGAIADLPQRLSLLTLENSNLRAMLEARSAEIAAMRKKTASAEAAAKRASAAQARAEAAEKENTALKQTLKYLQAELVKAGKKVQPSQDQH